MATTYRVRKGDTLGRIARQLYGAPGSFPLIVSANHISDPDRLKVGQVLVIPDRAIAAAALSAPAPAAAGFLGATLLPRTVSLNQQRLDQLHPILAQRGHSMVELCALAGIGVLVTQGLRTWEEQDALFARGRTSPPIGPQHIVTRARGGQSWHNFGLAFDIVVLDAVGKADWDDTHPAWKQAARIGKSTGLEWGGDWKGFKDRPHFQYSGGLTLNECRALRTQGMEAVWERVS